METFAGPKKVITESANKWVISKCQEGLFLKRCYIEIQLTLQKCWGIFRQIAGTLAVFQNLHLFISSTISCGTPDDGLRNLGWETVDKMIVDCMEILLQHLNEESKWEHKAPRVRKSCLRAVKKFRASRLRSCNARNSSCTLNMQVNRCTEGGSSLRGRSVILLSCYWLAVSNCCLFFAAVPVVMCVAKIMNSFFQVTASLWCSCNGRPATFITLAI